MRRFEDFHPMVLLIYFLAILVPVMVRMDGLMILAAILTGLVWQTMRKEAFPIRSFAFELGLIVFVTIINAFIYPHGGVVLFYIAGRAICFEGLLYGLRTGGMLAAAMIWCDLLSQLITGDSIQSILARMPKLALLLTMVFRLIPRYLKRYQDVEAAGQINVGGKYIDENGQERRTSDRVGMIVRTSAVFTWALENASQTADSMEMRGFGNPHRTIIRRPFYGRDGILLAMTILTGAGYLVASWIPILLLGLFPILYAGKEEIRWAMRGQNY